MRYLGTLLSIFFVLCAVVCLGGCGGSGGAQTSSMDVGSNLRTLTVTPANPSIARGTTQQFTATGTLSDGPAFAAALDRLALEAGTRALCLMCAEKEPLDCHRTVLVARRLAEAWRLRERAMKRRG